MKRYLILTLLILTACRPAPVTASPAADIPAAQMDSVSNVDILANLPEPNCKAGLTPENQEGPYYKANTPERTSLREEGMQGTKLILAGFVVNKDCFPIPHVWLDFWQADASGNYDNTGYALRGHQYTDNKGRYYLETIMPGLYASRPIEHIHVKVQAPGQGVFTTQLYFPSQPVDGLTVQLGDQGDYYLAVYNFVLP